MSARRSKTRPLSRTCIDVCVIGAGSGGFGAACAAARLGARVVVIEAAPAPGGTSAWAGVNNYEPVAGATGLPQEVYERLRQRPLAAALQWNRTGPAPGRPWGRYELSHETDYRLSLSRRSGVPITFEPQALADVMADLLAETGRCDLRLGTRFTEIVASQGRLREVKAVGPGGGECIAADLFIDATADILVARAAGCAVALGPEGSETYGEPSASSRDGLVLNNATLCYRVRSLGPGEEPQIQPLPEGVDVEALNPITSIRTYPNGDLNMNPLGLMTGREAFDLGDGARQAAEPRTLAQWHLLQTRYGFDNWKLIWISPMLGVRETYRLKGRYVLRQQDLDAGLAGQEHEDIIALADHSVDFHGDRPSREVPNGPYGIPFRCLLPREIDNLLVACRGASFSSIGASSCRLSRTIMVLGQAAGTAAALFGPGVQDFGAQRLQAQLRADGVALDLETGYLEAMRAIEPIVTPAAKGYPVRGNRH